MILDNEQEMAILASEIVSDSDKLTDIWDQLNYFDKHKVLRDDSNARPSVVEDMETSEIITRLLTLPSFISKSIKKLKSMPEGDAKENFKKLIEDKQKELESIKNLRKK